jgi:CRISPR-associated endonuclease Cas1
MAASSNLPQCHESGKSIIGKPGVLTLHGFGVRVRMQSGHLEVEYGVGSERRKIRLARVGHGLKRLVLIGSDGFVSLAALRWLADQDAAFVMLERNGKVLCVTGPVSPSDARLRRAQALAHQSGKALEISRELIHEKLDGEERVVREQLKEPAASERIARFRERLADAESLDTIRDLEAQAAATYWNAWSEVPVLFPRQDAKRVPDHWLRFGTRHSPLTGQPRLAVNPPNAVLNYSFALAESECRLALSACGLDPSMGFIHVDTPYRDSLALDVLETIRPSIEAWLLAWIMQEPFRRSDFFETGTGNCRLMSRLCSQLSETAPTWGRLVAPWAEHVARSLCSTTLQRKIPTTRLTQQHKREAKGAPSLPRPIAPPRRENVCRGCGKTIEQRHTHCADCAIDGATERLVSAAKRGRVAARSPESRAKHSASRRQHAEACSAWDATSQPAWLTSEVFSQQIQPLLASVSTSAIRERIGISRWYAGRIRQGYRPHPRHWLALAELASFVPGRQNRPKAPRTGQ